MTFVGRKQTMTAGELVLLLQRVPTDTPVMAAWEGVQAPILPPNFWWEVVEGKRVYLVDVEDYL